MNEARSLVDFQVNKALLTATAKDVIRKYGEGNPELKVLYDGFVNQDDTSSIDVLPITSSDASPSSSVGEYNIEITPGEDQNYKLVTQSGKLFINKADLNVVADNKSKIYKQENPELTFQYGDFMLNESEDVLDQIPTTQTTATLESEAGVYSITFTSGSDNNYNLIYEIGELTINKADQTIYFTPLPSPINLNDESYELIATSSSELEVIFESNNEELLSISSSTAILKNVGNVIITASQVGNNNYNAAPDVSMEVQIQAILGIDADQMQMVNVFPNPADDDIYLPSRLKITSANLYNLDGGLVKTYSANYELDVSAIAPGAYILVLLNESNKILYSRVAIK